MKITIAALGSQGDVLPFLALGAGLRTAGHEVMVATGRDFETSVRRAGLDFFPLAGDLRSMLASEEGKAFLKSQNPITTARRLKQASAELWTTLQQDTWNALDGADAAVYSYLCGPVMDVAEKTGLPIFLGILMPVLRTGDFAHFSITTRHLGRPLNRLTYDLFQLTMGFTFGGVINRYRREQLGLPPAPRVRRTERMKVPVLAAYSPLVSPRPADWPEHAQVTGYWLPKADPDWRPPPELEDFLAAPGPVVSIGFGSMMEQDSEQLGRLVREAVDLAGLRAVLVGGWGGLAGGGPDERLFHLDQVPYEWLFPRVDAAVHHGGAGTTGLALRAGVPSVMVPFLLDQPFWARRVHQFGAATEPLPRRSITADRLARALTRAVHDPGLKGRAAQLGRAMSQEDGVKTAVELIQRRLNQ